MLTDEMRQQFDIKPTDNVSEMGYDRDCLDLIAAAATAGEMVLDCGAGAKSKIFDNVINLEIVDYPSTDVIAAGQALPFRDNSFYSVLSIAVLEHVNDPFACAKELLRVLKPGGTLFCGVPFLQPEHGYPDHYFNMTRAGLRQLFAGIGIVEKQFVPVVSHPLFSLNWFLRVYEDALPLEKKEEFRHMKIKDFIDENPHDLIGQPMANISEHARWALACGTAAIVRKPH